MDEVAFLRATVSLGLTEVDRAIALVWFRTERIGPRAGVSTSDVVAAFGNAGFPKPNATRLRDNLRDATVVHSTKGGFLVRPNHLAGLTARYAPISEPVLAIPSSEFLNAQEVAGTRRYLEHVLWQANLSYEQQMFDCASVMLRRLVETLLIECFEAQKATSEVLGNDGEYVMLSGLIAAAEKTSSFKLGRDAKKALRDVKALGDRSAHNRRYTAKKSDLEPLRSGLRVLVEELVHVAGLK